MMAKTRILVVEDSLTVRKHLIEILGHVDDFQVVGEAADGQTAVSMCEALRPDVVTMDMMLPGMTGLEATEQIMAHCPTPILIVSASTNRGELFCTYDALTAGAVDVLEKPRVDDVDDAWERRFFATLRLVSRIRVITHVRAKLRGAARLPSAREPSPVLHSAKSAVSAVALGTSTGGPGALMEILRGLSPRFPVPILLVIHIGEPFGVAFAEWLNAASPLPVTHARDGEPLPAEGQGRVIMAPPNVHLTIAQGKLRLFEGPERHSCRPSVDVLFESVARELGPTAVACLLTGMGKDGAAGLLAVRKAGGSTIAQDESSSVVYGMPREAALLGAAERVLPLSQIATALVSLTDRRRQG